jgi:hypothetical protein
LDLLFDEANLLLVPVIDVPGERCPAFLLQTADGKEGCGNHDCGLGNHVPGPGEWVHRCRYCGYSWNLYESPEDWAAS